MNGLVGQGVPVTRETLEFAVEKAALSCARGVVQHAVIVDLITNGFIGQEIAKNIYSPKTGTSWEWTSGYRLDIRSWDNLKARMEAAGFRFELKKDRDADGTLRSRSWQVFWMGET